MNPPPQAPAAESSARPGNANTDVRDLIEIALTCAEGKVEATARMSELSELLQILTKGANDVAKAQVKLMRGLGKAISAQVEQQSAAAVSSAVAEQKKQMGEALKKLGFGG